MNPQYSSNLVTSVAIFPIIGKKVTWIRQKKKKYIPQPTLAGVRTRLKLSNVGYQRGISTWDKKLVFFVVWRETKVHARNSRRELEGVGLETKIKVDRRHARWRPEFDHLQGIRMAILTIMPCPGEKSPSRS